MEKQHLWLILIGIASILMKINGEEEEENVDSLNITGCNSTYTCVLPIECPFHVRKLENQRCSLENRMGVCCRTGRNFTDNNNPSIRTTNRLRHLNPLTVSYLSSHSLNEMAKYKTKIITGNYPTLEKSSPSYSHFRNSRISNDLDLNFVFNVGEKAMEMLFATEVYRNREELTPDEIEWDMEIDDLQSTVFQRLCSPRPSCNPNKNKYRTIDGSCNNIARPEKGMPLTSYLRLLPASYSDGIYQPRLSVKDGHKLPSPRAISSLIFRDVDVPNHKLTLMVMQYGQFITHDITHGIDNRHDDGSPISCCLKDGTDFLPPEESHPACMPIDIPKWDSFYSYFGQRCMSFVRSVIAPRHECTLGFAEQMNKVTHYLDGSVIYGSSPAQTNNLRSHVNGKLKVFTDYGRDLLPINEKDDSCMKADDGSACFLAGDTRVNQMLALVAVHLLFHREHNRIAEELFTLNPHWDDEKLFLESRRIVIAELQAVTYKDFLPAVLGKQAMKEFDLYLQPGPNYSHGYNPSVDASVSNEFASAAFRYGHSIVEGYLKIYGMKRMSEIVDLPQIMFNPNRMRKVEFFDQILTSLTTEPVQSVDVSLSESLTKYMFRGGNPFGVDLASINIQRGRDHGLRTYNDYRQLVGLPRITSFKQFGPFYGPKLEKIYMSTDDIDLWVGGLLEPKYPGSELGLTFRDIIADQFSRLKKGDRYFFENDPSINPEAFTPEQLEQIKKTSMSRLVCDNSDGIYLKNQAFNAFSKPGVLGNEFVDCSEPIIPHVNLIYWKENL